MEPIADESLIELKKIFAWVMDREAGLENPITVLVGGWAVFAYNRYWGSVDIDIITNSSTKRSLKYHLIKDQGYRKDPETGNSVFKETSSGNVVIDIANRGRDPFEGSGHYLDLSMIDGRTRVMNLEGQDIIVPDRSYLLMMKMKASWDRKWRLEHGRNRDPDHEYAKRIKDHSDILALIDPDKGANEIDVYFIGEYLSEHPFLFSVLEDMESYDDPAEKYGIDPSISRELVKVFKGLIV